MLQRLLFPLLKLFSFPCSYFPTRDMASKIESCKKEILFFISRGKILKKEENGDSYYFIF